MSARLERIRKEVAVSQSRYCLGVCLEGGSQYIHDDLRLRVSDMRTAHLAYKKQECKI